MIFTETKLKGAFIIEPEKLEDERGFFARMWDKKEFSERELDLEFVQTSISQNNKKGTIRGMHYQTKPYEETKIVRCTKGRIFDVIIDLRTDSKTFKKWFSIELNENNYKMLYIPKGFAHGFETLEDNSEVYYEITQIFSLEHSKGFRFDDDSFRIKWPIEVSMISQKDSEYKSFTA